MERTVLDTSALIAFRDNEKGSEKVARILHRAASDGTAVYVSFMTFMELFYCVWRASGQESALRAYLELKALPIERVESNEEILLLAGEIKATHSLSLADSWIVATAITKKATLIHKDSEFDQLAGRLPLYSL